MRSSHKSQTRSSRIWAQNALRNGCSTPAKQASAATIERNERNNGGASANISSAGPSQSGGTNDESAVPNVPDQQNIKDTAGPGDLAAEVSEESAVIGWSGTNDTSRIVATFDDTGDVIDPDHNKTPEFSDSKQQSPMHSYMFKLLDTIRDELVEKLQGQTIILMDYLHDNGFWITAKAYSSIVKLLKLKKSDWNQNYLRDNTNRNYVRVLPPPLTATSPSVSYSSLFSVPYSHSNFTRQDHTQEMSQHSHGTSK
jgi:hypothetical protein